MAASAPGELYREGRCRITTLVERIDPAQASTPVPACPGWSVTDVVAHLAGSCADILAGRLDGVATDPWTSAQVDARRGTPIYQLVEEWDEVGPSVEAWAEHFPPEAAQQWIADLTAHEHDIRGALGEAGARHSKGVEVGLEFLVSTGLQSGVRTRGLPLLEVRAWDRRWIVGADRARPTGHARSQASDGTPSSLAGLPWSGARVEGTPFEFFRALTGRRSAAQIRSFGWTMDPDPYLPAFQFGPFTTSPGDIHE